MKKSYWQLPVLLIVGVLSGWGVRSATAPDGAAGSARDVLATVGGARLTRADVERTAPDQFMNLARQRHTLLEQGLEQAVRLKLIEVEAAERGVAQAELVKLEVYDRIAEPSDEEIETVYRRSGAGVPLEQAAPSIRTMLRQRAQSERYEAFLDELRLKHRVATRLEPFRSRIETAGFPSKGPANAPVTIVEFSDFQCPYCYELVGSLKQVLAAYPEEVRFVYRHFPIASIHPGAVKAAEASMCAHDQDRFWTMHDEMFANQRTLAPSTLKQMARTLGFDAEQFDECLDSGKHAAAVEADLQAGRELGVVGTPALFVNGRYLGGNQDAHSIAAMVLDELRRAGRTIEPRRIEPVRFELEADGFPSKGPANAPVTIVEFADFQCPFCQRINDPLNEILKTYGDRVRLVYRQYPIEQLHPEAPKAAEAALCANAQGRFWEMHDAMYAEAESLPIPTLKRMARSVGLDGTRFDSCLDQGTYAAAVEADIQAGRRVGVTGTPALFINGRFMSGFQRYESLAEVIDDELAQRGRE